MSDLTEAIAHFDHADSLPWKPDRKAHYIAVLAAARRLADLEETYDTERRERKWHCCWLEVSWTEGDRSPGAREGLPDYCRTDGRGRHEDCGWVLVIPERANPEETE